MVMKVAHPKGKHLQGQLHQSTGPGLNRHPPLLGGGGGEMGVSAGVVTFCVWVTLLLEVPVVEGDVSLEVPLASSCGGTATGSAAAAATSPRS